MVLIAIVPAAVLSFLFAFIVKKWSKRRFFPRFEFVCSFFFLFGVIGCFLLHYASSGSIQVLYWTDLIQTTIPFFIFCSILFFYGLKMAHTPLTDNDELIQHPIRNFIITVICAWCIAMPNVYLINIAADFESGESRETVIKEKIEKSVTAVFQTGGNYGVKVDDPFMDGPMWNLRVTQEIYNNAQPGISVISILFKEGRLGIPYIYSIESRIDR